MKRKYRIPVFVPHEGCPHDCIFCNQRKITGVETTLRPDDLQMILRRGLDRLPAVDKEVEIAFFGGSFTGLPLSVQEAFYRATESFQDEIDGLRLSTRPDYIDQETLELAKKWNVRTIELGAQSASDEVLCMNRRFHTFAQTASAVSLIKQFGIRVGLQMMTGMYGSDDIVDQSTAEKFISLKPDCMRIYPTLVLKDTALEKLYREGRYQPQDVEAAVESVKTILLLFQQKHIPVIRVGLHAGEEIQKPGVIVAGPFHPAFRELVESRIRRDRLEAMLPKAQKDGVLEVCVPKREISRVVGHGRSNVLYFQDRYHVTLRVREEK